MVEYSLKQKKNNLKKPRGNRFKKETSSIDLHSITFSCFPQDTGLHILSKNIPYFKLSDNEDELDLHCIQLAEKMENDNVSGKRQRKKSQMAKESDEMDFIESTVVPSEQLQQLGEDLQHQDKQPQQEENKQQKKGRNKSNTQKTPGNKTKSTPERKEQQQKSSKKEEKKKRKSAQIEAGKTQAAAFFKDRLSAAGHLNGEQPSGHPSHPPSIPTSTQSAFAADIIAHSDFACTTCTACNFTHSEPAFLRSHSAFS